MFPFSGRGGQTLSREVHKGRQTPGCLGRLSGDDLHGSRFRLRRSHGTWLPREIQGDDCRSPVGGKKWRIHEWRSRRHGRRHSPSPKHLHAARGRGRRERCKIQGRSSCYRGGEARTSREGMFLLRNVTCLRYHCSLAPVGRL